MTIMDTPLSIYERMGELTTRMVGAARDNDWDHLCELERELAGLRDWLKRYDSAPARLDETERQRKVQLIKTMLADDREIRRHTEPWMEDVRKLIASGSRARSLEATYGAMR